MKKKSDDGGTTTRPYARMLVCGLELGLTLEDIRHMKFTHFTKLLWESDDMRGVERDEVVDAKPSDVKYLMSL